MTDTDTNTNTGSGAGTGTGTPAHPHSSTATALAEALGVDPKSGLTRADAAARLARHGLNQLEEAPRVTSWHRFIGQFRELVIWILLAAAALSALLGDPTDAAVILAIVLLNAFLGFIQEARAAQALASLRALTAPTARVLREGWLSSIPARELVPGDCVELEAGDQVPSDARLIGASHFRTQESALTGESEPVDKDPAAVLEPRTPLADRRNMVYGGTVAVAGRASAVVTATGMGTELGRIAGLLEREEEKPTPLQIRLTELGRVLVYVCLGIVAITGLLHLLRGEPMLEVLVLSVSLAVAAVPEGLPAVVTVVLAIGLQRMARRNALVRRLPSVETLGAVTVICTDKTGTLTRNEMTVREAAAGGRRYRITGTGYAPHGSFKRILPGGVETDVDPGREGDLRWALRVGARCNSARVAPVPDESGRWSVIGDPTEGALVVAALKGEIEGANEDQDVVVEVPFDAQRRSMSVVIREEDGAQTLYVKGAAEAVLPRCASERRDGLAVPLTEERRARILADQSEMASRALRVLALAYRENPGPAAAHEERELVFAGLAAMLDPPREEAREAVRTCQDAGIRPVMITGDHPDTALAIAREMGIAGEGMAAVTGEEMDDLAEADLLRRVDLVPVYARVSAEHKLRIVHALKKRGHVVAMTGDGVNDAPSLRAADIGIAMGVTGTDVTRGAADMVLLDDNFASIVAAVREGRGIFDNIQKFVHYLLATNAGEVLLVFFTALAGWPLPLLASQILWINLVTDGLPALALGVEPPDRDIMRRSPHPKRRAVITRRDGAFIVLRGLMVAAAGAAAFALVYSGDPAYLGHARTVAFCVIAFAQLLYAFAFRSDRRTLPELGVFSNPALLGATALACLLQVGVVTLPVARPLFDAVSLRGSDWATIAGFALAPVTVVEVGKILRERVRRARGSSPRV